MTSRIMHMLCSQSKPPLCQCAGYHNWQTLLYIPDLGSVYRLFFRALKDPDLSNIWYRDLIYRVCCGSIYITSAKSTSQSHFRHHHWDTTWLLPQAPPVRHAALRLYSSGDWCAVSVWGCGQRHQQVSVLPVVTRLASYVVPLLSVTDYAFFPFLDSAIIAGFFLRLCFCPCAASFSI